MGRKQPQLVEELPALTAQFQLTLRALVAQLTEARHGAKEELPEALRSIQALLEPPASWERCYEVEQRLVYHFEPVMLREELSRRLIEARDVLDGSVLEHYRGAAREARSDPHVRALLARLVNDLQWRYTVSEMRRHFMREITSKTGWVMVLVAIPFVLVALAPDRVGAHLPLVAAISGAFGATFSMLLGLKARLQKSTFDDLKLARSNALIVSRVVIGAAAGTILYFFIRSGLVSGAAFPELAAGAAVDPGPFAHLVVWCFLAGFSEKLVPSLLAQSERQATSASAEDRQVLPPTAALPVPAQEQTTPSQPKPEPAPSAATARPLEAVPTTSKVG
jgi:hypothetical protein